MSNPVVPPLFGEAVPRQCTRWIGGANCGKEPIVHVDWGEAAGFVCEEHARELGTVWTFNQKHPVGRDCGMPGAYWYVEENVCRCDDELTAAPAFAPEAVTA